MCNIRRSTIVSTGHISPTTRRVPERADTSDLTRSIYLVDAAFVLRRGDWLRRGELCRAGIAGDRCDVMLFLRALLLCVLLCCVSGAAVVVLVRTSPLRLEPREELLGEREAFFMRPFLDDASLDPSA